MLHAVVILLFALSAGNARAEELPVRWLHRWLTLCLMSASTLNTSNF